VRGMAHEHASKRARKRVNLSFAEYRLFIGLFCKRDLSFTHLFSACLEAIGTDTPENISHANAYAHQSCHADVCRYLSVNVCRGG